MAVNKIIYDGRTLIDLSGDSLSSSEQLAKGVTAHGKDGSKITGTLEFLVSALVTADSYCLHTTEGHAVFARE